MLATPGTWHNALEWLVVHRRQRLAVVLTQAGLTIEGPALYESVEQIDGQFGIALMGLNFWFPEDEVEKVGVDPEDDGLLLIVGELWLYLKPHPLTA